jgi:hypothetical protein
MPEAVKEVCSTNRIIPLTSSAKRAEVVQQSKYQQSL